MSAGLRSSSSVHSYWRRFHQTPLKNIGVDASSTIWGKLHLAGLKTIGDVIAIAKPGQFGIMDALIEKGCTSTDGKAVAAAIGAYREKLGLPGEPADDDQADQETAPRQALREACEAAQNGNGKQAATPPDPGRGKSARARRRELHPEEHVPEPAAAPVEKDLPLDAIQPSPFNPRKKFDQALMVELTESIKTYGVLQPIVVRPVLALVGDQEGYELVAGERRWRAAQKAGLTKIPARIHELTDAQVRWIRITENEQREDLSDLEKADEYARVKDDLEKERPDCKAVELIARAVHRSPASVYELLKLRSLPPAARKAMDAGTLQRSTAVLIARVPSEKLRAKAAKEILEDRDDGEPMSYREAKECIEEEYMVELKGAPFDRTSLDLVPSAGACTTCPKMTGNNRKEFPDARGDICTDPECYASKKEAHQDRLLDQAKQAGTLLSKAICKKLYPYKHSDTPVHGSGYVDLVPRGWPGLREELRAPLARAARQMEGKHAADDDRPGSERRSSRGRQSLGSRLGPQSRGLIQAAAAASQYQLLLRQPRQRAGPGSATNEGRRARSRFGAGQGARGGVAGTPV